MDNNRKTTREVLIEGSWIPYDSLGEDTEKSREFYQKCGEVPFAQGSFSIRINGVVQSKLSPDRIFYRRGA